MKSTRCETIGALSIKDSVGREATHLQSLISVSDGRYWAGIGVGVGQHMIVPVNIGQMSCSSQIWFLMVREDYSRKINKKQLYSF